MADINEDPLILYVFVRTDLPSMNPGKAMAHSSHAANAFTFCHWINAPSSQKNPLVFKWMEQTVQGFGTQINLKAPWNEVTTLIQDLSKQGFIADVIQDPTYPYIVDSEVVRLIDPTLHTEPPKQMADGRFICFRLEGTAAYVFGRKSQLEPYIGRYPLHP